MVLPSSAAFWLLAIASIQMTSASCLNYIKHDTIGLFSGAPLTFGYDYATASDCAFKCEKLEGCRAWLYVAGGSCELYRKEAVGTASSPNFFYGVCGAPASSAAASTPASTPAASGSVSATPFSQLVKIKDTLSHEAKLQKHKQRQRHHH
ncbi:hypothetical protein CNMCM6936_002223 [Aspergillus lentulus]|uniref:Apple domain-containing protein n=1 Tax=Aspergillus lentulus TaxID=293939 RepID=A0AAN6BS33_ASPLE|nr:hypothetical protein CNMCM6069_001306 [Aspergillus lentulus]KAF4168513.1 hypothetical protein CNMCM6936_002223 [Aspergillus lentulus]KAF4196930.1 hypothetical protein CNMCM8694_004190 [Aspergillus lentulus]KAF4207508.1 hypothetical protein CNMCM8927_002913 [Aspergillus lentulus]